MHSDGREVFIHEMLDVSVSESIDPMDRALYQRLQREALHGKR